MERGKRVTTVSVPAPWWAPRAVWHRIALACVPMRVRAFVRLHWTLVVTGLLLLVGFAVQLIIIWAVGQLIDVALGVMELWVELARKHLELTL